MGVPDFGRVWRALVGIDQTSAKSGVSRFVKLESNLVECGQLVHIEPTLPQHDETRARLGHIWARVAKMLVAQADRWWVRDECVSGMWAALGQCVGGE